MTNNSNSSTAEIGSAFTSMTTATAAQDNANNTEELGIEIYSDVLGKEWLRRYNNIVTAMCLEAMNKTKHFENGFRNKEACLDSNVRVNHLV